MKLNLKIVELSKDQNFMMGIDAFSENEFANSNVQLIANNSNAIADVYNNVIDAEKNEQHRSDYVVFMHSDVKFDYIAFCQNLQRIHGKYDVIGLCGTSKLVVSERPLNWFCGSRSCPQNRWGCVTHGELNNATSFFSAHHPDVLDHEVACIDGLCIMMSKKAIDSGLRFDSSVGKFDLYDTDLSMSAIMKFKLKIGVMVQKDLQHYSVGKSITTQQFLENDMKFRKKWGIPIK